MTIIADKPFTQLTNLNILDELRIDGVLVTPTEQQFVEVTANYTIDIDDDVVLGSGTFNVTLISLSTAIKQVTIKALASSTLTLIADGSDTIESGSTPITSNQSVTLVPTTTQWVII